MIGSYIKTATRNLIRNKLFSSINIAGLAISMSVGLLLIAFLLDMRSYDRFHKNGERIYRVTSITEGAKYASASSKVGKLIRERISDVEEVAIIRNDVLKDAKVGDHTFPIKMIGATSSLFRIFTFPMLEGDLKDPYSIVLTATTARKLFGNEDAIGKVIRFDNVNYYVTGIMKDVPFFSHMSFEAVVYSDDDVAAGSVYVMPSAHADMASIQKQLDVIAKEEKPLIRFELLPLYNIVVGESIRSAEGGPGNTGPHMPTVMLWILSGLAFIVILSACFNYTNLSIARAMRRYKEIGLRKAIGAGKGQILQQLLIESVMISLIALVLSFLLFLLLRPQLINLAPEMLYTVKLELTPLMIGCFIILALVIGVIAGFMPAIFFSKISAMNVLPVKGFRYISLRRALVVMQYTVTLIFITTTTIGYVQYKNILTFDLGFTTAHILNIDLQDNKPDVMLNELRKIPEVTGLSKSFIVTGVGNYWGGRMKYRDSGLVMTNHVDENYIPLHGYKLIAGRNLISDNEVIVNEQVLKQFNIQNAIGEQIILDNRQMTIAGVMQDFHYGKIENLIGPVAFTLWKPGERTIINAKIKGTDISKIKAAWKKIDNVHPFKAEFYSEAIEDAYREFSTMIKIIGFLSFLAISIASMGLFGMVVFTTETRLKEIGIRKVLGAGAGNLVYLLSRGFFVLLSIAAIIALPVTYLFFENMVLTRFPYHTPVQITELSAGFILVFLIAVVMIGAQTMKAAGSNPVEVLKSE